MPILIFLLCFTGIFANDFEELQKNIKVVENIILQEETIARAYERYIIEKKDIPVLEDLINKDYLGENFSHNSAYFEDFSLVSTGSKYLIKYRLAYLLKNDSDNIHYRSMEKLYKSNKLRNKTFYFQNNNEEYIYFVLNKDFALNLYDLIFSQKAALLSCSDSKSKKYCFNNKHVFMYKNESKKEEDLLLYYHVNKFKTGPIIINNNENIYLSEKEFMYLPIGALLIDFTGVKHIKTKETIRAIR